MKLDYSASTVKLNNAGLPTHTVSIWDRLMRFLILGADAGTFYVKKQDHAYQNCENLKACLDQDFRKTIDTIVDVSDNGRAGKNDHAVFALSVAASHSNKKCRSYALRNLSKVCRIGTHLFQFCHFVDAQRGWGTQLRREVGQWYVGRTAQSMAHQVVKYKSRVVIEGQSKTTWSHRDVLRKTHPKFIDPEQNLIAQLVTHPSTSLPSKVSNNLALIKLERDLQNATSANEVVELMQTHPGVPHEIIPTQFQNDPEVMRSLVYGEMGLTALIRMLGRFSNAGLLKPMSDFEQVIIEKLSDIEALKKARVHPMLLANALATYKSGKGLKGNLTWPVNANIVGALESALENSFANVLPTGKRCLIAVDISGSMECPISGCHMKSSEVATILALIFKKTESQSYIVGFSDKLVDMGITKNDTITSALAKQSKFRMGATDCHLPMQYAIDNKLQVDAFIVITDSETNVYYSHKEKPSDTLKKYRKETGIYAKMVVVGTTATDATIADPADPGMLDVVGFDTEMPKLVAEFIR
jgi:60 kDa SS-A/Ro ribonucleoprotein